MTPEDLEKLIKKRNVSSIAKALESLTEAERRKLSKLASTLQRDLEKCYWNGRGWIEDGKKWGWMGPDQEKLPKSLQRLIDKRTKEDRVRDMSRVANVAALGLCPLGVTKRLQLWTTRDDEQRAAVIKILSDRKPDWIDDWIADRMASEWQSLDWETFWTLYKSGVCKKPDSEDYYRFMARLSGWASSYLKHRSILLHEFLAEQPELIDDVWKFFETDAIDLGQEWDESPDKYNQSWSVAFCRLAEQGLIDRGRLLDASLGGLTTGMKQNLLSGFAKFHERLEPTIDEIVARQATYADLLGVKVNQVVSFAIKMLKKIDAAKRLDDAAFVAAAGAVFDTPTKSPAKSTLSLLKKIAKRSPNLQPRIAGVLIDSALAHPADEIVVAAIEMMAGWRDQLDAATLQRLADAIPDLPAVAQPAARDLVAAAGGEVIEVAASAEVVGEQLADLREEARAIEEKWRTLAGVDDALVAIESHDWPGPLTFSPYDVPVLTGVSPVAPIESIDELRDTIAHAVEQVDSPMDFERILDGISRLGREETDEFKRLAGPLIKRIAKHTGDIQGRSLIAGPIEMIWLVEWWLGDSEDPSQKPRYGEPSPVDKYLGTRCTLIRNWLAEGHRGPLLAMPTHTSGWIDPPVYVERWKTLVEQNVPILKSDAVLGLLRLAPDNRANALKLAATLDHPWRAALLWALGDDKWLDRFQAENSELWVAAANARGDDKAFESLVRAGLKDTGPNVSARAAYEWRAEMEEWTSKYNNEAYKAARMRLTVEPPLPAKDKRTAHPSLVVHARGSTHFWEAYWGLPALMVDQFALFHPGDASGLCAAGGTSMMFRIDDNAASEEPNYPYLRPLFDVDRPMGDLACLLLLVALSGRDQDVRGLAIDAAIESIQDGRLHPGVLGQTLAGLATRGWLKLNRLCPNLAEVARIGPLHAWVVCESLKSLLAAYETLPRDAHHLLALYLELRMQLGGELDSKVKEVLATAKGSGKTAKLVKSLLNLDVAPTPAADEARLQILQTRIDRAQRWGEA